MPSKPSKPPRPPKRSKLPHPTAAALVREKTGVAWTRAKQLCVDGRVSVNGERCLDPATRIPPDSVLMVDETAPKQRPGALADSAIVFQDRDIVVVEKPAGMLSVADEPGNRDTIGIHTRLLLRRMHAGEDGPLGVVHRLDRDTSGVMVFARTPSAQRSLAAQFKDHTVERVYLAIVHGVAGAAKRIESHLLLDRGDGLRGSHGHFRRAKGAPPEEARRAATEFAPLTKLRGATLVECRLETGRQHQIRIHLAELGHPLVGERVYIRDYHGPEIKSARPMLHARTLGFVHPSTGKLVSFERDAPADFQAMLVRLGARPP